MTTRIGIDIDGVCYQWTKTARYMLREVLPNSPYTKDGPLGRECTEWDYIKHNVAPKHNTWLWNEGIKLGLFRHGHLFPGTIKALRKLDTLGDLIAVTQRPLRAAEDTYAWIAYHRLPFKEVHILQGEPKTRIIPCQAFIDDKPENCYDIASAWGWMVAMPDRPWNQGYENAAVERIFSWDQFIDMVKRVKHD